MKILIVDDEQAARFGMAKALKHRDYDLIEAGDGRAALEAIRNEMPDLVFLDLTMPEMSGKDVLGELSGENTCEIIVVTADDSIASAVECMRLGAADYISKPYEVEQVRAIAKRIARRIELQQRVASLQSELDQKHALGALVGISRGMKELFDQIERAARAPVDILIHGETGTGKELIAREIHRLSDHTDGPFVAVNTAAIAESLAESELFGHVRGAFTGAETDRKGVFEQAHGGTLFLDEIGDMPLPAQTKILRALQERVIQPVGSSRQVPVQVRVVTATHQDLGESIEAGHFRQDLYYRIKGVELRVPPLRSRREDIILLANYFLDRFAAADQSTVRLSEGAINKLLAHRWPGNVRELEHVIHAAAAMCDSEEIQAKELNLPTGEPTEEAPEFSALADLPLTEAKTRLVETFERKMIQDALNKNEGNVSAAARQLGIHRQSLQQKITHLGIEYKPRKQ